MLMVIQTYTLAILESWRLIYVRVILWKFPLKGIWFARAENLLPYFRVTAMGCI